MNGLLKHVKEYKVMYALGFIVLLVGQQVYSLFKTDTKLTAPTGNTTAQKQVTQQKTALVESQLKKNPIRVADLKRQDAYYKAISEQLYTALNSYIPFITDSKVQALIHGSSPVHNAAELKLIYKYYGVRKGTFFMIPVGDGCTLLESIKSVCTASTWEKVQYDFKFTGLLGSQIN